LLVNRFDDDAWWDEFFADRAKPCPFFAEWPDENLVAWFRDGLLAPGRVLELGCGNGRNAVYLAGRGCRVDAVDFSARALEWARERAEAASVAVGFQSGSIFEVAVPAESYDLVYDSGCFHHLPPHRRADYLRLVHRALTPGGHFGLVCFRPEGGSGYTDEQVYERDSLGGGLGYSEDRLRALWDQPPFALIELRQMRKADRCFAEDYLGRSSPRLATTRHDSPRPVAAAHFVRER
jgi:SAM-dependent methyltransferase